RPRPRTARCRARPPPPGRGSSGELLEVVAVGQAVVAQDVAVGPQLVDDAVRVTHARSPVSRPRGRPGAGGSTIPPPAATALCSESSEPGPERAGVRSELDALRPESGPI